MLELCLTEGLDCRGLVEFYAAGMNLNTSLISDSNPHFMSCFSLRLTVVSSSGAKPLKLCLNMKWTSVVVRCFLYPFHSHRSILFSFLCHFSKSVSTWCPHLHLSWLPPLLKSALVSRCAQVVIGNMMLSFESGSQESPWLMQMLKPDMSNRSVSKPNVC